MCRREELKKLGPLSLDEKITAGALGLTVALWIFGGQLGIGAVAAALLGLAVLLITNVVTWKECLSDNQVCCRLVQGMSCMCSMLPYVRVHPCNFHKLNHTLLCLSSGVDNIQHSISHTTYTTLAQHTTHHTPHAGKGNAEIMC